MGFRQYRHSLWQVSPASGGSHYGRKIQRRWRKSTAGPACAPRSPCTCCGICREGIGDVAAVQALAAKHGVRPGSINPNLFQDQVYKFGSLGNPDPAIRKQALQHMLDSIEIARSARQPRCFAVVRRRVELSWHCRTFASVDKWFEEALADRPPAPDCGPTHAGGIQTL